MKKAFVIFLFMISPAFADDQNVYDFFRQLPNSDSAIVDEQTTAVIKRHMANLLYPVDYRAAKADGGTSDWNPNA